MGTKRSLARWALALLFLAPVGVHAQETRVTVSGRVVDPQGAVITGVTVSMTNKATGVVLKAVTNEAGNYRFDISTIGKHELAASQTGFKSLKRELDLRTGDRLQVDIQLEVGEITDSVTVTSDAPLLETTTADRGQVLDNERINTIPLAQGNTVFLLNFAPGANPGASANAFKYDEPAFANANFFRFHGAPSGTSGFTLNGVNNTMSRTGGNQGPSSQPPTEAVQEMKISHSYDATSGHNSGSSVDITLKSGTNSLHGAAYGFFRDSSLDANSFFDNRAGNAKPPSDYRRIGFNLGGPIVIPKLYNGTNRTFFSYTYEDTHQSSIEQASTLTVPTPEQLRGDFSKLLALGPQYQIYDPLTIEPTGDGFFRRSPFPGNIIPESRINPIARKLAEFWPKPNLPGGADGSLNFHPGKAVPVDWYQSFVRIDHNLSPNDRISVHHGYLDHFGEWVDDFDTLATGLRDVITRQNFGADYVHVVNSSTLLNFRYGLVRHTIATFPKSHIQDPSGGFDITTLGLAPSLISQLDLHNSSLPHVFVEGYKGLNDFAVHTYTGVTSHSLQAQVGHLHGNHDLKMGFDFLGSFTNSGNREFLMPRYNFGSDFTNGPLNTSASAPIGQGLAAFLLGQPTGGFIRRIDNFAAANQDYAAFVQDNWRVTPKLTLNFGLRFEKYTPATERYDRSVRGLDFESASPVEAAARTAYARNPIAELPLDQFRVRGGLSFAGAGGQPSDLWNSPSSLFAPRFGFAYQFANQSVLRGGYGIFFLPLSLTSNNPLRPIQHGFVRDTQLVPTVDNGLNFVADIRNPFPSGIFNPLGRTGGLATDLGQNINFFNTDLKTPYVQRWSLGIQRVLPLNTVLEVGYVGSRGTRLIMGRNLNFLPEQYLSKLTVRDQSTINLLTQAFPNPFAGLLPGSPLNVNTTNRGQLLKPFPHFQRVNRVQGNQGYSWYHGLEARLERRLSQGVSYIVSYTWSKDMEALQYLNESDPVPYETLSVFDRTHIFGLTAIWELPFGKGRRFGSGAPAGLSKVISGWEVSSVWRALSGYPVTFGSDVFTEGNFTGVSLPTSQRTAERWFNTNAGFVRQAARQPAFHLRTFPLRFNDLRTDGIDMWDISVIKNTSISERTRLQFYAQFLNAFNHANFGNVNTSPSSGSFGRVTGELTWPRRIMFGLRFTF
ncbi:MAG: TonB-dependent receptor [Acidobacteriota bacterium]